MSTTRSYKDAIDALNSLQSNAATLNSIRAAGGRLDKFAIPESIEYLARIGYKPEDLNALNAIHITGTKGKGSTSAFCNSILSKIAPDAKIGLYTSPHLVAVRERIRINGRPLEETKFAQYFFEVWDRFEANPEREHPETALRPAYFRFMTTMAFHVFLQEKVDATILEVGIGGTLDSTNIVPSPITTGVTALGIDHVFVLGHTVAEIAHHKGGIFKAGVPALTINQPQEGLQVLRQRAAELEASSFTVIPERPDLYNLKLGLAGSHQISNASLAVALCQSFVSSPRCPPAFAHAASLRAELSEDFITGLKEARWPGRCQYLQDPHREQITWHLDGAHTVESLACCGEWFARASQKPSRSLIFNCTSGRNALSLLTSLKTAIELKSPAKLPIFDRVVFCTNTTYKHGQSKGDLTAVAAETDLGVQHELAAAWRSLYPQFPSESVRIESSIEDGVGWITSFDKQQDILVCGSLHLVGGVIEVAGLSETAL